ncbi:MAG TPA: hypothetical protein VLE02_04540, partial [Nitrosarchaeum sp.]|nr:hypothetical protein [Nitrosarchaeum sp.]
TQKEGEKYLSVSDHKEAYYKYLYSREMVNKVWDPILEINSAVHSADMLELEYKSQTEKQIVDSVTKQKEDKTCFWIFCW